MLSEEGKDAYTVPSIVVDYVCMASEYGVEITKDVRTYIASP